MQLWWFSSGDTSSPGSRGDLALVVSGAVRSAAGSLSGGARSTPGSLSGGSRD